MHTSTCGLHIRHANKAQMKRQLTCLCVCVCACVHVHVLHIYRTCSVCVCTNEKTTYESLSCSLMMGMLTMVRNSLTSSFIATFVSLPNKDRILTASSSACHRLDRGFTFADYWYRRTFTNGYLIERNGYLIEINHSSHPSLRRVRPVKPD